MCGSLSGLALRVKNIAENTTIVKQCSRQQSTNTFSVKQVLFINETTSCIWGPSLTIAQVE